MFGLIRSVVYCGFAAAVVTVFASSAGIPNKPVKSGRSASLMSECSAISPSVPARRRMSSALIFLASVFSCRTRNAIVAIRISTIYGCTAFLISGNRRMNTGVSIAAQIIPIMHPVQYSFTASCANPFAFNCAAGWLASTRSGVGVDR